MKLIASLVALAAAAVVAAPAFDIKPRDLQDDSAPHIDDPNFISAVMRAHWYWRKLHCAQDLVWDPKLAEAALEELSWCPQKQKHERLGSNLSAVGPAPGNYDDWIKFVSTASHGWHEEEILYPYENPKYDGSWGHFTQMVWRNSSAIGCAVGHCNDSQVDGVDFPGRFYCYYEAYGNNDSEGQFKQQVWGPVCSDPSAAEVQARDDVHFDWKVRR
ncbi:PR-1-like protein [Ophiobolus disseminans]|uniref:PR-1-like protein n=1 Tax=Ophiobolus disseminans TaxID=1469910 RepID=A0A6A6ZM18_9PLEO|nr:PR-1-like protein [Ophiobolus disseminans]